MHPNRTYAVKMTETFSRDRAFINIPLLASRVLEPKHTNFEISNGCDSTSPEFRGIPYARSEYRLQADKTSPTRVNAVLQTAIVPLPASVGMTVLMLPVGGLTVNTCATVEKVKHPACKKFFIPSGTTSYTTFRPPPCTEFRHDSCNTAPRWGAHISKGVSSICRTRP